MPEIGCHVEIDQDDVELAAPNDLERLVAAPDEGDVVAVQLEHAGAPLAQGAVVVDDEDPNVGLDRRRNRERIATDSRRWRCHIGWRVGYTGTVMVSSSSANELKTEGNQRRMI